MDRLKDVCIGIIAGILLLAAVWTVTERAVDYRQLQVATQVQTQQIQQLQQQNQQIVQQANAEIARLNNLLPKD